MGRRAEDEMMEIKSKRAFRSNARRYAEQGLSPIPIRLGKKAPCISKWTDFCRRQPTNRQILEWTKQFPDAGLGLALGTHVSPGKSALVAIDIDQDDLVEPILEALFGQRENSNSSFVAKHGAKGLTIFALAPTALSTVNISNEKGMAVEVLASGRQTVLPPSLHPNGSNYHWINGNTLLDTDLLSLPTISIEFLHTLRELAREHDRADRIERLTAGNNTPGEMTYPGNVNEMQARITAKLARVDYLSGRDPEEGRKAAVETLVAMARKAYEESGSTELWDDEKQALEAGSQYDRAHSKGPTEWGWPAPPERPGIHDPFRVICASDWQGSPVPAREWLVSGWIPQGQVTALYGDGGVGKTYLAQQLMTACAIGRGWLGLQTEPCKAIGLFCEDDEKELHRRQEKINQAYTVDFSALGGLHLISRPGEDNTLIRFSQTDEARCTHLWEELARTAKEVGAGLIVIDTAADTFSGNENFRTLVRQYVSTCLGGLARETGATVLVCAHPSRTGLSSGSGDGGSTAWNNTVRSRLYLQKSPSKRRDGPDDDQRTLSRKKSNYGPTAGDEIDLVWVDGYYQKVAQPTEGETLLRQQELGETFLTLFDQLIEEGQTLSDSPQAGNYAPKLMLARCEDAQFVKEDFARQMKEHLGSGTIKLTWVGPPSKKKRSLVRGATDPE